MQFNRYLLEKYLFWIAYLSCHFPLPKIPRLCHMLFLVTRLAPNSIKGITKAIINHGARGWSFLATCWHDSDHVHRLRLISSSDGLWCCEHYFLGHHLLVLSVSIAHGAGITFHLDEALRFGKGALSSIIICYTLTAARCCWLWSKIFFSCDTDTLL